MKITFSSIEVESAFGSMAEGMWDVARDDHVSPIGSMGDEAERLDHLLRLVWDHMAADGEGPLEAPDTLREAALSVRDNLFSQEHEWSGEDDPDLHYRLTEKDIELAP